MKQLMIKPEKCTGCRTCELVCSFGHYEQFNPRMSNVTVMEYDAASIAIPVMCLQCEEACCMKVCPVKAITQDENGAMVMNYERCIGCKMCMNACPLGNISYSPRLRKVFKCDLCGGELTIRKDDAPETVKARLDVYHAETEPLKDFYAKRGKLKTVDNQPTIEATTEVIEKALGI